MRPADWFVRQLGLPWPGAGHPDDADQARAAEDDRSDQPFVPPAGNQDPDPAAGDWHVPEQRWTYAGIAWEKAAPAGTSGESAGEPSQPAPPASGYSADRWSDDRPPIWPRPPGLVMPAGPGDAERTRAGDTLLLARPAPGRSGQPGRRRPHRRQPDRRRPGRTMMGVMLPAVLLTAVAAVAVALFTGSWPRSGPLAGDEQQAPGAVTMPTAAAFGTYPGQPQRGLVQAITRVVTAGRTIVATGSQASDGVVRPRFLVSADAGASWHLAPVHAAGGVTAALGHPATLLAGGQGGWAAVGPHAVWTSRNGLAWTLAAAHGISPQRPGDSVWVITRTADGFLAAGANGITRQAPAWTSRDGVRWQRMTAAQLGLAGPGETVLNISHAATHGNATVISGTVTRDGISYDAAWLSTTGGTAWTRITIPAGPGTGPVITGLGSDRAGLLAVRPARTADGTAEGVAYFSPDGLTWRYAATIGAAGGWSPGVVKGSDYGLVVTGTSASGQLTSYTSDGAGTAWRQAGPLGEVAAGSVDGATVAPDGTVIAVGHTAASPAGQQPVLIKAGADGTVRPVSLASIPGAIVPEMRINATAVAEGLQIAVGSAGGYPAVWRNSGGSRWTLVSSPPPDGAGRGWRALTSVTHGPAGWLAVGVPGPVVLTSADGTRWAAAAGGITADLAGVSAVAAASGPAGYVIAGTQVTPGGGSGTDAWWSPDLISWTRAHDVTSTAGSGQVLAVAASSHGFVSVGSRGGHPAIWTTADGRSWDTTVLPVPGGARTAVLQQVAVNGLNVVALGQAGAVPFAEFSADGGRTWQRAPFGPASPGTTVTALTAGPAGFTAGGLTGPHAVIWTSGSGANWKPSSAGAVRGSATWQVDALAPDGPATSGIGTVITAQGQQIVTFTIPKGPVK